MKRLLDLLLADWRRKLLALAFAIMLWGWLSGRLETEREVLLEVAVTSADASAPGDFELLIQVPPGWALTSPEPGSAVAIRLVGTPSALEDFTARQCAARFNALFNADPTQDRLDLPIRPKELEWLRPNDASYLLDRVTGEQGLQTLSFERVAERDLILSPTEQPVVGEPSPVHELHPEEMVFSPTQVHLRGPKSVMNDLMNQIEAAHSATATLDHVALLSPLTIDPTTRGDVTAVTHLHPDLARLGIDMDPPAVTLTLPVRLAQPVRVEWLPSQDMLKVLEAPPDSGDWQVDPWTPTPWVATLPDLPSGSSVVTAAWVREHVMFVLPMVTLRPDSLPRTELNLIPVLIGLSPEEQRFYAANLIIQPLDPAGWTVTVTRVP